MLTKTPKSARLGAEKRKNAVWAVEQAFEHFELDAKQPADWDRLRTVILECEDLGKRRKRGRPKGTYKLTGRWYLQLMLDARKIRGGHHPARLSSAKLATLLKESLPQRYCNVSAEWLRQCLLLRGLRTPSEEDFEELMGASYLETIDAVNESLREVFGQRLGTSEGAGVLLLLRLFRIGLGIVTLTPEGRDKMNALSPNARKKLGLYIPRDWVEEAW